MYFRSLCNRFVEGIQKSQDVWNTINFGSGVNSVDQKTGRNADSEGS
jgi:hypothetical protein